LAACGPNCFPVVSLLDISGRAVLQALGYQAQAEQRVTDEEIRTLRAQVRPAANVSDTVDALDVVDVIKASPVHMALVHDEYGHFQGVVTNADILETIVGDFRTDESPIEPDAVQRDDGSWLIAGSMPVDEMADRLFIALPPERSYHTAAGLEFSISSVTCRPSAKALIIKAGVSRSSISMAAALTGFWPGALPLGGGAQRFRQIRSSAEH
jgi:Mg2+/Co2+ transporter CorB